MSTYRSIIIAGVMVISATANGQTTDSLETLTRIEEKEFSEKKATDKEKEEERLRREPAPLALALDLAFGPTVWAEVKLSTSSTPKIELTRLVRQGYYKLELIQLIMLSAEGRKTLKETLERRKKGAKLVEIALAYRLDYDRLYESALAVEEIVDKQYLPRFPQRRPRPVKDAFDR